MLSIFRNSWKVPEIRKKLFFIILMLAVYRIGTVIMLPGVAPIYTDTDAPMVLIMMLIGGNPGTIFAMGIQPYITASIIMQLLTVAIPALERMKKEGEEGRKKINQITRVSAIGLAFVQGTATVYGLSVGDGFLPGYNNFFVWMVSVGAIVTGTMFIMWIAELITEKGIGNGTSFIITANILAALPGGLIYLWDQANINWVSLLLVLLIVASFVFIIAFAVLIQEGERKIPVQYSKKMVGKQLYGGQTSHIPVKVNIAGVMSIIFASSMLGLPMLINNFFPNAIGDGVIRFFHMSTPTGALIYVILIFCFTFFYTSFSVNPAEMAENLKKNGGAIPGVRSGAPTRDYIARTVNRLSWIGACFYSAVALIPILFEWITGFIRAAVDGGRYEFFGEGSFYAIRVGFGGTTLLIVVGVGLELVKQMESQLLTRHYKGFLS
ncbi:MAG: preprotein translocase subunit SecY [Defluviitaleaceae bacterium]|nr:preprotein translocase subunit SecY [Defluviitaleaceae bacterium]